MHRGFSLHRFRFHLEPKAPLRMPAYNKGNVIRGGFGSAFRLSAVSAQAGLSATAQAGRIVCHGNVEGRVRDSARGRQTAQQSWRRATCLPPRLPGRGRCPHRQGCRWTRTGGAGMCWRSGGVC